MIPWGRKVPGWKLNFCSEFYDIQCCLAKQNHSCWRMGEKINIFGGEFSVILFTSLKWLQTQCPNIRPISPMQWKAFCKLHYRLYWKMWIQKKYVKSSVKLWVSTFKYLVVHQIWENFWLKSCCNSCHIKREIIGGWVKLQPDSGS